MRVRFPVEIFLFAILRPADVVDADIFRRRENLLAIKSLAMLVRTDRF